MTRYIGPLKKLLFCVGTKRVDCESPQYILIRPCRPRAAQIRRLTLVARYWTCHVGRKPRSEVSHGNIYKLRDCDANHSAPMRLVLCRRSYIHIFPHMDFEYALYLTRCQVIQATKTIFFCTYKEQTKTSKQKKILCAPIH